MNSKKRSKRNKRKCPWPDKQAFGTQTGAQNVLFRLTTTSKKEGTERLRTYHCSGANHWHIGHAPKRRLTFERLIDTLPV